MRDAIKIFKVLSDQTRLRTLNLILERECCVCEVMQALDISQSKASRSLTALYDAGLLNLRKEGLWSLYSIDTGSLPAYQIKIITGIREDLADNPLCRLDKKRLESAERKFPGHVVRASAASP